MAQAPPLPADFNPGCHLTAYDVYVIRKHGAHNFHTPESSSWWNARAKRAKYQWRSEYNRLASDLIWDLDKEADAVNKRWAEPATPPPPTALPPPLPSSFPTNKYLTGDIVYMIRKLGEDVWRSGQY